MNKINLIIIDDNFVVRRGLCNVFSLDDRFDVVGEVSNGIDLLEHENLPKADVLLMDIRMNGLDGIQTTQKAIMQYPKLKVLSLTSVDDPIILANIINAGASGYMVYGTFQPNDMIGAVLDVYNGKSVYHPDLNSFFSDEINQTVSDIDMSILEPLTERENNVLSLIASGCDNSTIASIMNINEKTVKNYISKIYSKLGVTDRREAILFVLRKSLMDNSF